MDQQRAGIKTSSPFLNFFFLNGLHDAKVANKFADYPELTITAYLVLIFFAKKDSNFFVSLDIVS